MEYGRWHLGIILLEKTETVLEKMVISTKINNMKKSVRYENFNNAAVLLASSIKPFDEMRNFSQLGRQLLVSLSQKFGRSVSKRSEVGNKD